MKEPCKFKSKISIIVFIENRYVQIRMYNHPIINYVSYFNARILRRMSYEVKLDNNIY